MDPYKIVKREEIFNGKIVRMIVDYIELSNGKIAQREIVLHHRSGVGILPVDDDGNIFLVRQYRHSLGEHILEIPAGILEDGENPEDCASRELEEEIGYRARKLTFIVAVAKSVGVSNDKIHLYIAQGLEKSVQKLDDDEFLEVEQFGLPQCLEMIKSGELYDAKTILAIQAYMLMSRE